MLDALLRPFPLSAAFLAGVALGFVFAHRRAVRLGVVAAMLPLAAAAGLSGRFVWPFFNWHLYPALAPRERTFHQLRAVDDRGREFAYDARAAPPALSTPIRRIAGRIPSLDPERADALGAFLLAEAESYRRRLASGGMRWWRALRFPRHQLGVSWAAASAPPDRPLVGLRVVRIAAELSPDARAVVRREETPVWSHPDADQLRRSCLSD